MTPLLAGLALGVAGSAHCLVMCGPLAALVPSRGSSVQYHLGRLVTYVSIGLGAGWIGASAAATGLGRGVAVFAGLSLLVAALTGWSPGAGSTRGLTRVLSRAGSWARRQRRGTPFVLGLLNGLLPCGLLYGAVVAALAFGDAAESVIFMAGFTAGTTPSLVLAVMSRHFVSQRIPNARRLMTAGLVLVGVLLIVRGSFGANSRSSTASSAVSAIVHAH